MSAKIPEGGWEGFTFWPTDCDVRITDDLIWEDRQTKKKLKEIRKQAYGEGKRPRFHQGNLYIDGVLYKSGQPLNITCIYHL